MTIHIEIPARPAWAAHGACRGVDPDLFFPERGASVDAAQAVCSTCPVIAPCAEHAIGRPGTPGEKYGIWGGLSERERRRIRQVRRQLREAS